MNIHDYCTDLLAANSDDTVEDCCDALCDYIVADAEDLTQADADEAITTVRMIDRDENYHAAHVRDAIRDNTELTV